DNDGDLTKNVQYRYDMYDRLILRSEDPDGLLGNAAVIDSRYVYDGQQILLELDGNATEQGVRHSYLWGPGTDQLLADEQFDADDSSEASALLWALADRQGTVRDWAQVDEHETASDASDDTVGLVGHADFDSYGNRLSATDAALTEYIGYTG